MIIETNIQHEIQFEVEDEKTKQTHVLKFKHSQHSLIRSSQRGISKSKIEIALMFGQIYFKQGLNYYVLGEKDIPDSHLKEKSHLKNIVVVVSGESNTVITCYKSKNPFKLMKHKSNELFKNYKAVA